jgi:hypothetical protein
MSNSLRWLGIAPAALAGWYLAIAIGLYVHGLLDSFCPPDDVVSGMCLASWYPLASRVVICFGAALAAFLVVVASAFVAPSHRYRVAWIAFAIGAGVALVMSVAASTYMELFVALTAGLFAVWIVRRLATKLAPNNSFKPTPLRGAA